MVMIYNLKFEFMDILNHFLFTKVKFRVSLDVKNYYFNDIFEWIAYY